MKTLLIINGPAYGSDETFNAIRLALALAKRDDVQPRIFLMGDAVTSAIAGQTVPDGYYHLDRMLKSFVRKGGQIACCGTCMDARGLTKDHLIEEAPRIHHGRTRCLDRRSRPSPHVLTSEEVDAHWLPQFIEAVGGRG